jgi:uncharacterized protein
MRKHPDSPLQPGQSVPAYAPYDPRLRFELPVRSAPPRRWEAATATDGVVPFERIGRIELPGLGSLDVWWLDSYGGGVFVPMRDGSSGRTTYGAGRYLIDTVKGADLGGDADGLVIDLNFAYNPSCAYDPAGPAHWRRRATQSPPPSTRASWRRPDELSAAYDATA